MKKFVIARYYFNSLFREQADATFIDDLRKNPYLQESKFDYAVGNLAVDDKIDGYTIIRGTFGRVRKGDIGEIYDKEKQEFKKKNLPDTADILIEFIINPESHLIFVEFDSRLRPQVFAKKFKKIHGSTKSSADLEIDFIFIKKDVYEAIQKWKRIEKVTFKKLRPSNPSSLPDYEEIERFLKESGSESTNLELNAPAKKEDGDAKDVPGLNYKSKLIGQSIALSADGYGEARILGVDENDTKVEVETKSFLRKIDVDFARADVVQSIIDTVKKIKEEHSRKDKL